MIPEEELLALREQCSRSPLLMSEIVSLPPLGQLAFSFKESPACEGTASEVKICAVFQWPSWLQRVKPFILSSLSAVTPPSSIPAELNIAHAGRGTE